MEVFIELLSNGDWRAWAALVVGVLLLLLVCYKCILNLGKLLFFLSLIGLVVYGLTLVFPDQAAQIYEKIRALLPSAEVLEDHLMPYDF